MGKHTINDLREHNFSAITESPYELEVIRSGKIHFNGPVTTSRLTLTVSTSGPITFYEVCNVTDSIDLNISTTAGIWMEKIQNGNLSATINTGIVHLTYQNDKREAGSPVKCVVNLKNYGKLYIQIPKERSVNLLSMDGFGKINWHDVTQTTLENADYYIIVSGRSAAFLDISYPQ